jgi:hypothetical protein
MDSGVMLLELGHALNPTVAGIYINDQQLASHTHAVTRRKPALIFHSL